MRRSMRRTLCATILAALVLAMGAEPTVPPLPRWQLPAFAGAGPPRSLARRLPARSARSARPRGRCQMAGTDAGRIVICGGGTIGAALAYSLSKRGCPPLIIEPRGLPACESAQDDKGAGGGECDEVNFRDSGLLLPLLATDSALEDMARISFDLHEKQAQELSAPRPAGPSANPGTSTPASALAGCDHEFRRISHLHLVTENYQRDHLVHEMELFKQKCGDDYDERIEDILLLPGTLRKRAPWLDPATVFGAHCVHDVAEAAQIQPEQVRTSLLRAAVAMGSHLMQGSVEQVITHTPANETQASSRRSPDGSANRIQALLVRCPRPRSSTSGSSPAAPAGHALSPDAGDLVEVRAERVVFALGAASVLLNTWLPLDMTFLTTRTYGILLELPPATRLAGGGAGTRIYAGNVTALLPFPPDHCEDGLPLPAEALIVPQRNGLVWAGSLDEVWQQCSL